MHIHFSSSFGFENVYPALVKNPRVAIQGHLHLGEKGFLEILELHLGLTTRDVNDAIRISVYKKAVAKAINEEPGLYILKSFENDAWSTARQLLLWRDELELGLWNFDCDDIGQKRLFALSKIEEFTEDLPLGVNDRWRQVLEMIQDCDVSFLDIIKVYQPQELTHPFFTHLFELLSKKGVTIQWQSFDYTKEDTDLGKFKKALLETQEEIHQFKGDGSLQIIKAENEKIIADTIGELLVVNKENDWLLLVSRRGHLLEESLLKRGFPALGLTLLEEDSALDQLFKLISLFLWEPTDPEKLLQFLTLPTAPIHKKLRTWLAETYANEQGVSNYSWNKTVAKYLDQENVDESMVQATIDQWFERKRFDSNNGSPVEAVISIYQDLTTWAERYLIMVADDKEKQRALSRLANQCQSMMQLVRSETDTGYLVKPLDIDKWSEALESENPLKSNERELGAFPHINYPANITESISNLIWWNFLDEGNPISHHARWTETELEILTGCKLMAPDQMINLWHWQMSHAVLSTTGRLLLCSPDKSLGEEAEQNPLYSNLQAFFSNVNDITTTINYNGQGISLLEKVIPLHSFAEKHLPKRKLSWNIDVSDTELEKRTESFSSLSKLFFHPHSYFLRYLLNIQPVVLPEVKVSPLLLGKLAHKIFEYLCKDEQLLSYEKDELPSVVLKVLDQVVKDNGAILLMPKNKIKFQEFKTTINDSFTYLVTAIKENGWKIIGSEEEKKDHSVFPLKGIIDLILKRGDEVAIVDLKWGGYNSRIEELDQGLDLQLVIYDRLVQSQYTNVHLNYFIITRSRLLGRNKDAFKETVMIKSEIEEHLHRQNLIDKMFKTYNERWNELSGGMIEVGQGMNESELKEISKIWADPDLFLPMQIEKGKKKEERYSDYDSIIGTL